MGSNHQEHLLVEQDLRDAIGRGDFTLAYQRYATAIAGRRPGSKRCLRWRHPLIGPIEPDQFIPLAEKTGLIVPLGRWALEAACAEAVTWTRPSSCP